MSDEELLRSAGLILPDEAALRNGITRDGVTIAAILLFGKDSTIMSVLPQHKTDAIFRVVNTDRYDDRDVVITNLIESYDRLLAFGQKILIEKNRIFTENANLSHGHGVLQLATFDPFQKNPPISKVFREIGLADELGSGMRNTFAA